jgi:type I restriction enzyme S subunit
LKQRSQEYADNRKVDKSILAKAFRGELVPWNPNDEPAAVLQERIQAERPPGRSGRRPAEAGRRSRPISRAFAVGPFVGM